MHICSGRVIEVSCTAAHTNRHRFYTFQRDDRYKPLRPCVLLPRLLPCSCSSLVILTSARASTAGQSIGAHLMTSATGLGRDVLPGSGLALPISTLSDCMVLPSAPQGHLLGRSASGRPHEEGQSVSTCTIDDNNACVVGSPCACGKSGGALRYIVIPAEMTLTGSVSAASTRSNAQGAGLYHGETRCLLT